MLEPIHTHPAASPAQVNLIIVEDNRAYLDELCQLLDDIPNIRVVATFHSVTDTLQSVGTLNADVALVDLGLPDGCGIDIVRQLSNHTDIESLVLTVYDDDEHLFPVLEAGAVGYILKDQTVQSELVGMIEEAVGGGAPMSLGIARRVLDHFRHPAPKKIEANTQAQKDPLTTREREVLEQLSKGYSAKKVANELGVAYNTIRCHQKNIYKKLHVSSVVAALSVVQGKKPH